MVLIQLRVGIPIRCTHACWVRARYPAIVVATDGQVITGHYQIADLAWPERTGHTISKIYGAIDATALDVGEDRFECGQVPVYIRDDGDAHVSLPRVSHVNN